jgi:hypothetical protein
LHVVPALDLLSAPVSRPLPPLFSIAAATMESVAHHLSFPVASHRAPPCSEGPPRAVRAVPSPPLSSSVINHAGELRISISRPPHCELVLSIVLGGCAVVHGRHLCSPSLQLSSHRPPLHAPHYAPCTLSPRGVRRVYVDVRPIMRALTLEHVASN